MGRVNPDRFLGFAPQAHESASFRAMYSLDAALALVERVLPGWSYGLRCSAVWADHHQWAGKPVWEAIVANPGESDNYEPWCEHDGYNEDGEPILEYESKHCSPALALCLALLRAHSATSGADKGEGLEKAAVNG